MSYKARLCDAQLSNNGLLLLCCAKRIKRMAWPGFRVINARPLCATKPNSARTGVYASSRLSYFSRRTTFTCPMITDFHAAFRYRAVSP